MLMVTRGAVCSVSAAPEAISEWIRNIIIVIILSTFKKNKYYTRNGCCAVRWRFHIFYTYVRNRIIIIVIILYVIFSFFFLPTADFVESAEGYFFFKKYIFSRVSLFLFKFFARLPFHKPCSFYIRLIQYIIIINIIIVLLSPYLLSRRRFFRLSIYYIIITSPINVNHFPRPCHVPIQIILYIIIIIIISFYRKGNKRIIIILIIILSNETLWTKTRFSLVSFIVIMSLSLSWLLLLLLLFVYIIL